ncbi:VRR-NUC domain-containing protein [Cristinia sonorae]|uniref:Fanconi-associated nuclease n=1 Tax=Cristinia sonorae TaxID=1940300 RepID=A0A8K0UMY8_9AGAR|nr:VRR-NUC domain-containing protein [Cristinia sonorae]
MTIGSPTVDAARALIFGQDGETEEELERMLNEEGAGGNERRESMYVALLDEMLGVVLEKESHLFIEGETRRILCYARVLKPGAKYLLVRLLLRKAERWHRLSSLKYVMELGDGILPAVEELCGTKDRHARKAEPAIKVEEPEVIDLTLDEEDILPIAGPSKQAQTSFAHQEPMFHIFGDDASEASTRELLECLTLPELKEIAKKVQVKSNLSRADLIDALLDTSMKQTLLSFPVIAPKASKKGKSLQQTRLAFPTVRKTQTQQDLLREMILKILVQCIRIDEEVIKLFRRFNLVYFRNTMHTPTIITPSILVRAKKRTYPAYIYTRTSDIWPDREALLSYERALEMSAKMEEILDSSNYSRGRSRSITSKLSIATRRGTTTSPSKKSVKDEEDFEEPRITAANAAKELLKEIYKEWNVMLEMNPGDRSPALERFTCGYVHTRTLCKGSAALATLKDYEIEYDLLDALLNQRRWRRGRRGRWYERQALILEKHLRNPAKARETIIKGLEDEDTSMVWRVALERRLTRLEKKLPVEERHICEGELREAELVTITGVRLHSLVLDSNLNVVNNNNPLLTQKIDKFVSGGENGETSTKKPNGKSIWQGRDGNAITVEMLALEHYEDLGFKGFHCEGRIVTTLFGFLFWDILFAPVPGVFETPYQSAPLDLTEDTFYTSRKEIADARLDEIKNGRGEEILTRVYDENHEKKPMCVGVRWDMFERQDLVEITRCIGGPGLATICLLLCQDYSGRCSGVPDLFIWNAEKNSCKFVEVKGPGDRLSENQNVWIDVLRRVGVSVEVCHVEEEGKQKPLKVNKEPKAKKTGTTPRKRKRVNVDSPESNPEDDISNLLESEGEDDVALVRKRRRVRKDADPDVLPQLAVEELQQTQTSTSTTVSTRSSSATLALSPASLHWSSSRTEFEVGPSTPSKRQRFIATSSP